VQALGVQFLPDEAQFFLRGRFCLPEIRRDAQDLKLQIKLLKEAGVIVFHSNAKAASFCCELLK
jgi:hypothetical protein